MLRVEDIMTKKVYLVDFVGLLTDGDLIDPAPHDWVQRVATVADLMDPEGTAVYENDPALEAAHQMVTRNLTQVVVLNTKNQLVGMLSAMDLVRAIDKGASFEVD